MNKFIEKEFNLKNLKNISEKTIAEHLKLYAGYVKNTNLVLEQIEKLNKENPANAYLLSELYRRFSFEFNGVRNHEYYFNSLEKGKKELSIKSSLFKKIKDDFSSFDNWLNQFKNMALTRGIGWAMLSYDPKTKQLLNHWVDEQHMGHLVSTSLVMCLDMWEHAYYLDYSPTEKKKYIEAFFENLDWGVIEENFKKL